MIAFAVIAHCHAHSTHTARHEDQFTLVQRSIAVLLSSNNCEPERYPQHIYQRHRPGSRGYRRTTPGPTANRPNRILDVKQFQTRLRNNLAVDSFAQQFTDWADVVNTAAELATNDPSVNVAKSCLGCWD